MTMLPPEEPFYSTLRTTVADVLDVDEHLLGADTHFIDELGVDSLMALEVMVTLERCYHIKLSATDLKEMTSLRKVYELLQLRLPSRDVASTSHP